MTNFDQVKFPVSERVAATLLGMGRRKLRGIRERGEIGYYREPEEAGPKRHIKYQRDDLIEYAERIYHPPKFKRNPKSGGRKARNPGQAKHDEAVRELREVFKIKF